MIGEPFETIISVTVLSICLGAHGLIIVLSIVGLLCKPIAGSLHTLLKMQFSSVLLSRVLWLPQQLANILFPWIYICGDSPDSIEETPFTPSRLLMIHTVWALSSVGLWVGATIFYTSVVLVALWQNVLGTSIQHIFMSNADVSDIYIIMVLYFGLFAILSFRVWARSVRSALDHYQYVSNLENAAFIDDTDHYLSPFRNATLWAFMTPPIGIGGAILALALLPS